MQIDKVIKVTANKSHFQRLLICSILSKKKIKLNNFSNSDDNSVLINCFILLGYSIDNYDTYLIINRNERIKKSNYEIDVKSSGFAARVLPIILAFDEAYFIIKYDSRMFERNLDELKNIFEQLGLEINILPNYLEFYGKDNIQIASIYSEGKLSSQYASALLIAMSFLNNFKLILKNLTSKSYIDLTIDILDKFGFRILNDNYTHFVLKDKHEIGKHEHDIEGDWSGAANLLILASILGKGTFSNLNLNSKQGDLIIYKLLQNISVKTYNSSNLVIVEKSKPNGFIFDADNFPDLVPALVPLALYSKEKCIIKNVNRLKYKESNRLEELLFSYKKLNSNIKYNGNDLIINPSILEFQELDSKNDHRLAMSYAIAYKLINPRIQLIPEICVNKSYPNFYEQVNLIEIYE